MWWKIIIITGVVCIISREAKRKTERGRGQSKREKERERFPIEHHLKLPLESLPWANARDVGSRQLWRAAFTYYVERY